MLEQLRKKMKSLALLDAIIEQEWEYRYFSYDSNWSDSEEIASLRDGCGGSWFFWTCGDSAAYKCLSPEDGLMPTSDLEQIKSNASEVFNEFVKEPAFSMDQATCIWFLEKSNWVKHGITVNWIIDLQTVIDWKASDYHAWATEYYERELDLDVIEKIFLGEFNTDLAKKLNTNLDIESLLTELPEIGITP